MSDVLGTADVMARYRLKDARAARRLMDAAGAFVIGRRLLVRPDDLDRYEEALRAERRARVAGGGTQMRTPRRARARRPRAADLEALGPDWWEQGPP